ncbi:tRNA 4-thiouridine(8) synthase ThiI [Lentibacillus cibarius]|uniref:Probable tRNA sulfurtransferase n=1 Tax=Lentibacillus cibarius TaxID=2583219 RepID=A0A549YM61_9BACI|nr:tRNA uracil 4-sulfurtransferase ThiI [Lentibacillus cibarius]TMN21183.1 tRNA 4-thiouridine(8) synthase ThiI [Lentibacillus cibarius]TRM12963.1 tRNA 4-thiouridine(8) synthase ThiI [Lentibacillus cibarius]
MQYDHILIRYGEMALKGKNRKSFIIQLQNNLKRQLRDFPKTTVKRTQGRMFILLNGHDPDAIIKKCQNVFGIQSLSLAVKVQNDEEQIKAAALWALQNERDIRTFKVSVKRIDKDFPIRSQQMNRILGAYLLSHTSGFSVDVHEPDLELSVEIRKEATYITSSVVQGLGGLPVGSSGKTLLLLSGGIDSPVAGFLAMKRGVQVEAIHFHSPPFTSDRAKQKVLDLAEKLTHYGNKIKVHVVPFTNVQQHIFREMPENYAMTIMRRMMLRISEYVCRNESILSMTTGESLGQVASQTMESMNAINEVTNYPILRPLVAMDKDDIIKISKTIDTYDISIRPYEDCCTIFVPKSPKTRPSREKVNQFESQANFSDLIEEAVNGIEVVTLTGKADMEEAFNDLF